MRKLLFFTILISLCSGVFAAEQGTAAPLVSQAFQVICALFVVICLIVVLATFFRKHNLLPAPGTHLIKVLSSTSLAGSDKLLLVQIGNDQLLLSQGNGGLNKLHHLSDNIQVPEQMAPAKEFNVQQLVGRVFRKKTQGQEESHV